MRTAWMVVGGLAAPLLAGCARGFHPAGRALSVVTGEERASGAVHLQVAPLPPDLSWLSDAIRLFGAIDPRTGVRGGIAAVGPREAGGAAAAASMGAGASSAPPSTGGFNAREKWDLRFVTLPLPGE